MSVSTVSTELWDQIKREWAEDPQILELINNIQLQPREYPKYKWANGILTRKGKLVVGASLKTREVILEWLHALPIGGILEFELPRRGSKLCFIGKAC